jgi:endonuclease/exonuclease/phosphatase family metal-dependent hydrolase
MRDSVKPYAPTWVVTTGVVGIGIALMLIVLYIFTTVHTPQPDMHLRVITHNVRHGEGMDGKIDVDRQGALLMNWGADLIAIQELDQGTRRSSSVDQLQVLQQHTGMYATFAPFMAFQDGEYGLGILTPSKPFKTQIVSLPEGELEPRSAVIVHAGTTEGAVVFACAHLDWLEDDSARFAQIIVLLESLKAYRDYVCILAGDLNDLPTSRTLRACYDAGFLDTAERHRGEDSGFTFGNPTPSKTIDYILVRPPPGTRLMYADATVIQEAVASDHRPLMADIRLSSQ